MDALDIAMLALRLALALVLYLFLWLVVRTSWHTLRSAPESPRGRRSGARDGADHVSGAGYGPGRGSGLRLMVLDAGGSGLPPGHVIEVLSGATLGRAERASLVLADPAVSAEHARLALLDGQWVISDLGSTNGTLLNQALVQGDAALEPGDVVALGNVRLKVLGH